jgi:fibronectin type 3 domain-containing protein
MTANFTVVGSPTFSAGKFGNAITTGTGNYLTFPDSSQFRSSTGLTLEWWMKTTSGASLQCIFGRTGGEWMGTNSGKLWINTAGLGGTSLPLVNDGQWHHVAVTSTNNSTVVYLDGVNVGSSAYQINTQYWPVAGTSNAVVRIGSLAANADGTGNPGYDFQGQLDDFRISNIVRYTANFTPPANRLTGDGNTLGLYRFESDGTDSSADTSAPAANPIPTKPTSVTATASAGQVTLSWTASTDDVAVTGYRIYRRGGLVGTTTGATTYTETGLVGGVLYSYTVTAVDADGHESDASTAATATTPQALKPGAPNVIWDTDMSSDVDDLYTLALLHGLADLGEVNIVGAMMSGLNAATAMAIASVNTFYGRPNIPVGVPTGVTGTGGGYPATIASAFPHTPATIDQFPNATTLYRQLLSGDTSGNLLIISTGYLNNVSALLSSPADGIDARTGAALIAAKVKRYWCMGGVWPTGSEFNFKSGGDNGASAYNVVNNWPTSVYYVGYEVGGPIYSGGSLLSVPAPDPRLTGATAASVTAAGSSSSDNIDAYLAIRSTEGLYDFNTVGHAVSTSDGTNSWAVSPDPTGALEQGYAVERARVPIQQVMNLLTGARPAALSPTAPTAPSNLAITPSGSNMVLTWTDNSYNETGFLIERRDSGVWAQIGSVGANVVTFTDTSPGTQTNRAYRVRATNAKGNSPYTSATYYASWTQKNLTTPASLPVYSFFHTDHLRYLGAGGADTMAILDDFTSAQTFAVDVDAANSGSSGSYCIYFLYQDASNWYRLRLNATATLIEKSVAGTVTQVGANGTAMPNKQTSQHITLNGTATGYTAAVDGTQLLSVTDTPTWSAGKTGVGGVGGITPIWSNYATTGAVSSTPTLTNTVAPAITPTTAVAGTVLTTTNGTWSATPDSYTYVWKRAGAAISGATAATYTVVTADLGNAITCTVTAVKATYTTGSATSNAVTPAAAATAPTAPTGLTATAGNTTAALSWTAPANGGSPITDYLVEYQPSGGSWATFADGTSTATTATVTGLTNGTAYAFRVSAINAVGTSAASSTTTATPTGGAPATALTYLTAPAITGNATLTADPGTWSATPDSYSYQWKRANAAISGATSSTYTLVAADVGSAMSVTVTAVKAGYSNGTSTSAATATAAVLIPRRFVNVGGVAVPLD